MLVSKDIFVKDLKDGQDVTIPLLVESKLTQTTKSGQPYLNLVFADKTAKMPGKVWNDIELFDKKLMRGKISIVMGRISTYNKQLEINVKSATLIQEGDEFDLADYQASSKKTQKSMQDELMELAQGIEDDDYRTITLSALAHPTASDFWTQQAAKSFHHAFRSGLLEHSLSVARLAGMVAKHYAPILNPSLLMAGAILHDIGKTWEFTKGPGTDYSTAGRLLGHISIGNLFITQVASEITNFPQDKLLFLQHLILSHHGELRMGSAQTPKILEAVVLHHLDNLDSKVAGIHEFIEKEMAKSPSTEKYKWTGFFKLMEDYYLETPSFDGLEPAEPSPEDGVPMENPAPAASPSAPTLGTPPPSAPPAPTVVQEEIAPEALDGIQASVEAFVPEEKMDPGPKEPLLEIETKTYDQSQVNSKKPKGKGIKDPSEVGELTTKPLF
ncbi:MAG: HD domain-containing protein [Deltaproteobacteria bacterium]|jgi:3'-5' exoribonuclease|nr:HD domain-containing protein [Deltaproteobacteria bacterium]